MKPYTCSTKASCKESPRGTSSPRTASATSCSGWPHQERSAASPHAPMSFCNTTVVLQKRKVAIAEEKYLEKRRVPRCTFDKLAGLYLAWSRTHHLGFRPVQSRVKRLQGAFGSSQLSAITPLQVDAYLATRTSECRPTSVNRDVQVLRHMFTQAIAWGKAIDNLVAHIKPLRVNNRRLRYLSH